MLTTLPPPTRIFRPSYGPAYDVHAYVSVFSIISFVTCLAKIKVIPHWNEFLYKWPFIHIDQSFHEIFINYYILILQSTSIMMK